MKSIITLKKKIVKFFDEKGFKFLTSVPKKRMQEMILTCGMKGNSGKSLFTDKIQLFDRIFANISLPAVSHSNFSA